LVCSTKFCKYGAPLRERTSWLPQRAI
jgi:hypothetical protein